jgi:hypothetical protein
MGAGFVQDGCKTQPLSWQMEQKSIGFAANLFASRRYGYGCSGRRQEEQQMVWLAGQRLEYKNAYRVCLVVPVKFLEAQ